MADSGGYWANLVEAQKLTQATLVPGIIEEDIRRGGIGLTLPVTQFTGTEMTWNKEVTVRTGRKGSIGGQMVWTDNMTLSQKSADLKIIYDQTPLNKFVQSIYGTINNYRAITLRGMMKGLMLTLEDRLIYDDETYPDAGDTGNQEFDGLHAIAAEQSGDLNIDEGGALSLYNIRTMIDAMKAGMDFILMPFPIARRLDSFFTEGGSTVSNRSAVGSYQWSTLDMIGMRVPFFNNIPIIRSDFLVAEQAATGEGSNKKAAHSSGTAEYSIFGVKLGQLSEANPGLTLGFGGGNNSLGELFKLDVFDKLEGYDAEGFRMTGYVGLAAASKFSVARIHGITNAAITE